MIVLIILWACVIFLVLVFISFGAFCVLHRTNSGSRERGTSLPLSLCNCFACGVFLSTCFLGLLPHIRRHELKIRASLKSERHISIAHLLPLLTSELIVLIGFLFILFVEELVRCCDRSKSNALQMSGENRESAENATGDSRTLIPLSEDTAELLVPDDECSSNDSMDEVMITPKIEFRGENDEYHHGRTQAHSHDEHLHHLKFISPNLSFSSIALLFGLSSHSIVEGIALGLQQDKSDFYSLLIAIMLHEILCSFAFGVSLVQQRTLPKTALLSATFLAISIPFGMFSSILVSSFNSFDALLCRFVLEGLAAGTFIYVSCVEILSSELNSDHRGTNPGISKAIAVILGVLAFFIINFYFGHHIETLSTSN